ncbi:hypothetical protein [Ruegeria conchae]|uniref:Uncharacterized protein n=1 Tax=Ruegeria conchae TaxID=981384 RepID=A0A497YPS6_9RHOB|nr:hypothetical protein [Ruegeria conchae]RLJ97930.1 hypothetical protein CLV75_4275 [Ruegeria conchae]
MSIDFPNWPPEPYNSDSWPPPWLRFEREYPNSERRSRLISHSDAPYIAIATDEETDRETLGAIASDYLDKVEDYLTSHGQSLNWPEGWGGNQFNDNAKAGNWDLVHWLNIWPPVDSGANDNPPQIASWNLSRDELHRLPATIVMVATEFINDQGEPAEFSIGVSIPMLVEETDGGKLRVIIRSFTAEYPVVSQQSWSTVDAKAAFPSREERQIELGALTNDLVNYPSDILNQIGAAASVEPRSIDLEQIFILSDVDPDFLEEPVVIETVSKALGSIERFPNRLSYSVTNKIKAIPIGGAQQRQFHFELLSTETCPLITHVGEGEAKIWTQVPPASKLPFDPANPALPYDWDRRRPTRTDDFLDRFRELGKLTNGNELTLEDLGFRVRRCPDFVPGDQDGLGNPGPTKVLRLPANKEILLRSNEYSALLAYVNCVEFFDLLRSFGIILDDFVVRAERDIQIFYRYGIAPGPGKDGRTVNAQVAYDCKSDAATLPTIRMNLALAELTRWDRPLNSDGERTWAQPLGLATDKRWMLHEFGHYLLAARLGKLEFDFAHSAGDAMAAIVCDPESRLADPRNGVAESYRGITFPFVFSTRRHDRSPTLGWAWYGELNRSVIESPPTGCDDLKGYLTEQILSTTLFRLYRALGGDSMDADAPDVYLRQRASFVTVYLLVRAIQSFGQSPSRAEMLELAIEQIDRLQAGVIEMPPIPDLPNNLPQPDCWKGGMVHKVVRWSFETQGMFVENLEETHNGMGKAPDVDVYIEDSRPLREMVNGSWFNFGVGSYCPVSLDWRDDAQWTMPDQVIFGNRGSVTAEGCTLRRWYGVVFNPEEDWGLSSIIIWLPLFSQEDNLPDIGAGDRRVLPFNDEGEALAEIERIVNADRPQGSTAYGLALYEITCPDDRANTDPLQSLGVAVGTTSSNLPKTPRALTDLVANDNNLGLRVIRFI